jgi:GntR family transcriptional regulator
MSRTLNIDPRDPSPLWRQIEDGLRRLIASGALSPGVPVPSVREMAKDLTVNPATVVRAYQRLIDAGFLQVRRGEGTFVALSPPSPRAELKRQELQAGAMKYAGLALEIGASRSEATTELEKALQALFREKGEGR